MSRDPEKNSGGRVLLVDDDENVLLALTRMLTRSGHQVVAVDSGPAAMAQIEEGGHFDVMLTDIRMPGVDGIELAKRTRRERPELDVIVMTGYASVDTAVEAIKLGAYDYLLKPFPDIEVVAATVERVMTRRRLEAQLAEATDRLRASQESFASIVERTQDGILVVDTAGTVRFANGAAERLLKRTREELVGHGFGASITPGAATEIEFQSDLGESGTVEVRVEPTEWHGEPASLVMLRDITARKQAEQQRSQFEEQLLQAQKMEAIGALASGVAHDFSNTLTAIMGVASFMQAKMELDDAAGEHVERILKACRRGSELTRRLLDLARKDRFRKQSLALNSIVTEVVELLSRTVPRTIEIRKELQPELAACDGNATQINQVLLNLAINAVDAMPNGGVLTVATLGVELGPKESSVIPDLQPGDYVKLQVSDTGAGMDRMTRQRAFEPFFTTKPHGKGTGLGLAMVYNTIRSHGGTVSIFSESGRGTTVTIYLPTSQQRAAADKAPAPGVDQDVTGAILLVDDEPLVLSSGKRLLENLGYEVLLAEDGEEALERYRERGAEIALVILDLNLPVMDGEAAFQRLKEIDPGVRVIFASAYAKGEIADELYSIGAAGVVRKPYSLEHLAEEVSRALKPEKPG